MKDGGYAFPWGGDLNECLTMNLGMTLRDWFAGQALSAMITQLGAFLPEQATEPHFAELSYRMADAMIAERNK